MDVLTLVLLVIQIVVALILVIIVLVQKASSHGALSGMGGGGGNSVFSVKTSHDLATKITFIFLILFMLNGLILATIYARKQANESTVVEQFEQEQAKLLQDTKQTEQIQEKYSDADTTEPSTTPPKTKSGKTQLVKSGTQAIKSETQPVKGETQKQQ